MLMCIANAEESSKLDEIALRPTALNSYNVHMKSGLRLGKLKQYRLSFYHFSRAALVARTDQQNWKAKMNAALSLFKRGKEVLMEDIEFAKVLLRQASKAFGILAVHHNPGKCRKHAKEIEKLLNGSAASSAEKSSADFLDQMETLKRTKGLTQHPQTAKRITRIHYNDTIKEPFGALSIYLQGKIEPVVIENAPLQGLEVFQRGLGSWRYVQSTLLPETFKVNFGNSNYNLYSTSATAGKYSKYPDKIMTPLEFIDAVWKGEQEMSGLALSRKPQFPYASIPMNEEGDVKPRQLKSFLKESSCLFFPGINCKGRFLHHESEHVTTTTNLWLGISNISAVTHYDVNDNCYLMMKGRKQVLLAPPKYYDSWYHFPAASHHHRQSQIFDLYDVDSRLFPKFQEIKFQETILHPGDVLFIPMFWAHNFRSLEPSVAMNVWSYNRATEELIDTSNSHSIDDILGSIVNFLPDNSLMIEFFSEVIVTFLVELFDGSRARAQIFLKDSILDSQFFGSVDTKAEFCNLSFECAPSNISSVFPGFLKDKIGKYARAKVKAIAEIEGRNNFPGVRKLFAANSIIGMAHNAITLANTIGNGRRAFNHGDSASLYICYMLRHCIYRQLEDDLTSSSGPDDIFMFEL